VNGGFKVTRSNKIRANKTDNEPPAKILTIILEDVVSAATLSFEEWSALSANPFVPLTIPVDSQHQYRVTQTGVDAAHRLTEQSWNRDINFRQTIARIEFERLAFRAIGETIRDCRANLPDDLAEFDEAANEAFFSAMADDYAANLKRLADAARPTVDRHIPCQLFHSDQTVSAFSIGPVEFLPRADWIYRYVKSQDQLAYINQYENRELSYEALRDRAFAKSSDRELHVAFEIVSSLRAFEWVATIRIEGHEPAQSHRKASTIVGLALDAIGLRFQVEDARRFTKAGRQHLFSEDRIATSVAGDFLRGWSTQMPGLSARPGALATKMQSERPFLDAAGKILDAYVRGRQSGPAPHLIERWVNALYWVGEARREGSDFMAIVDYGCAADVLSGAGGNAAAMTTFAEAALNPKGEPVPAGMLSVADAVTKVYREGRNKLAHGEMSGLLEELSVSRAVGDALLGNLFDAVTFEIAKIIDERPAILTMPEKHAYRALEERLRQRN
jgi:hypothetical protein